MNNRWFFILLALTLSACGEDQGPAPFPPDDFGPYRVGFRYIEFHDAVRDRSAHTAVWYPGLRPQSGAQKVMYLSAYEGRAYLDAEVDHSAMPYPLVMFSHGFQGISVQSFTLCEQLASQGFIVAAPNHEGNTIFDNSSDEEVAQIVRERPVDIVFTLGEMQGHADFASAIDSSRIGIAGHSFGGYTTLVLAGAEGDADTAKAHCAASGGEGVFCPYVDYWQSGDVLRRPAGAEVFKAALPLAPGGYGAFGDQGLSKVDMPMMVMGGDLDDMTGDEVLPIYAALPAPKHKIIIAGAGHMSFTDICRLDLPVPELEEMCDPLVYMDIDRAFEVINVFATAFFRYELCGEKSMDEYLDPAFASTLPEATYESETE
ncbi:alpha/beta hydrolase family protein [Myxococcota bacterium]